MINSEKFTKRLEKVINYYGESASSFAEKIGVQRSSISHILSGRNKPSLDFVLKILASYPEVELYWLLNGKGNFPHVSKTKDKVSVAREMKTEAKMPEIGELSPDKKIQRIVIFYEDGTFENYNSKL